MFLFFGGVNIEVFDLGLVFVLVLVVTYILYMVNGVRLVNVNLRFFVLLFKIRFVKSKRYLWIIF